MVMNTKPEALYHFTCHHSRRQIGTSNCLLLPNLHPWIGTKLLWLTTEPDAERERTGLTMNHQKCDRMEVRYVVSDLTYCRPWLGSPERDGLDADTLHAFEYNDTRDLTADVEHWWISSQPVRARFDRSWSLAA